MKTQPSTAPNSKISRSRRANDSAVKLQLSGEFDAARASYCKSLELNPDNATAHHNLAFLLAQIGNFESAHKHASKACELEPTSTHYLTTAGQINLALKHTEAAIAQFQAALDMDTECADAWDQLGRTYLLYGQYGKASCIYADAAKVLEFNALRQVRWATAECLAGNLEHAEVLLKHVLVEVPDMASAWSQLGVLLYMKEDYGSARDALQQALGLDRRDLQALRHLALVEVACNRRADAIRAMGEYVAIAPDDATAALDHAVLLLSAGHAQHAQPIMAKLDQSAVPRDRFAFYQAIVDSKLGARQRARRTFQRLAKGAGPYAHKAQTMLAA